MLLEHEQSSGAWWRVGEVAVHIVLGANVSLNMFIRRFMNSVLHASTYVLTLGHHHRKGVLFGNDHYASEDSTSALHLLNLISSVWFRSQQNLRVDHAHSERPQMVCCCSGLLENATCRTSSSCFMLLRVQWKLKREVQGRSLARQYYCRTSAHFTFSRSVPSLWSSRSSQLFAVFPTFVNLFRFSSLRCQKFLNGRYKYMKKDDNDKKMIKMDPYCCW